MDTKEILNRVQSGALSPDEALAMLKAQPFEDLGYAKIDHHRAVRQGAGEVIYGAGKTAGQIVGICRHLADAGAYNILITRLDAEKAEAVCREIRADYDPVSKIAVAAPREIERVGSVAVPTSVGYGASFNGLAALLSMLNSCASGVSVVNIDNGFGAGFLAHRINTMEGIR